MRFGHLLNIGEKIPHIFSNLSKVQRAKVFLTLYNACVSKELRVPLRYAVLGDIRDIFDTYICSLLDTSCLKFSRANRLCMVSTLFIHAFKNKDFTNLNKIVKEPRLVVAKLIKMVYKSGDFELCFDANTMFFWYVYDKIATKHFDKDVHFKDGVIYIQKDGKNLLSIMPRFKQVCANDLGELEYEMQKALEILKDRVCESFYIVFPRNESFRRHLEVRHCACDYGKIKLVPYTICNKIF